MNFESKLFPLREGVNCKPVVAPGKHGWLAHTYSRAMKCARLKSSVVVAVSWKLDISRSIFILSRLYMRTALFGGFYPF